MAADSAPAHVCDVEEAVDSTKVYECTVLGDVLDRALEDASFFQALHGAALQGCTLALEEHSTRQDNVASTLVKLNNLELVFLIQEFLEISNRSNVDLAAWQECLDADVDRQAAATRAITFPVTSSSRSQAMLISSHTRSFSALSFDSSTNASSSFAAWST